ncbi:MAG: type II toxin-antitoxin system VapC family toxin [Janthinobacterium lividum]
MVDWLADSNIWLRSSKPDHSMYLPATQAVKTILEADEIFLVPQTMNEFWRVVTAPLDKQRGGFGWEVTEADRKIQQLEFDFPTKYDNAEVYRNWRTIALTLSITGIKVHDTCLVAAMLAHGLTHILTFNVKDFQRYVSLGITVVHPDDIK